MNLSSFSEVLATLAPILEPLLLQEWSTGIFPLLQAQVTKIANADEQFAAQAILTALDAVAKREIAKL